MVHSALDVKQASLAVACFRGWPMAFLGALSALAMLG
jgi:hypothetical protein